MKSRFSLFLGTLVVIGSWQTASAIDYTWNGITTGTWDTTGTNWVGIPTDPWNSANGLTNKAIFNLASLNANVSGTVYTNGITFSTTGALAGEFINLAGITPTISVAASQTGTIGSVLSGSLGLTKASTGTLILSGENDYTGGTAINAGTLQINTGGTLGSTSGALSMGTGSSGVLGTVGNLTVNTDTQAGAYSVQSNTSNTSGANIGQLSIASGKTLTASSFSVGVSQGATNNAINTALGTGSSNVGTLTVTGGVTVGLSTGGTGSLATTVADLSGLASFNAGSGSGEFRVGYGVLNNATLTLASTANTISVTAISVGETTSNGNSGQNNILNLGAGTNALQATTINIGTQKASGVIQFAGSSGTVVISGIGGAGTANIFLGNSNSSGTYQPGSLNNGLLLAGHTATVNAGTVIIGNRTSTGAGTLTAQVTFDTGTFNASSITVAKASSGHASSASAVNGTLTLGSNSASTGITNVSGNLLLASHTSSAVGVQTATGVLNILGGTVNVNTAASATGGILDNSTTTTGSSNTTLTLDGGTLNLNGGVIGGDGTSGKRAITNLNFRSGTLQNVSQINGGSSGLTKTTAGTLILGGTNSYTGTTVISEGRLVATSANALGTSGSFGSRTTINTGGTLEIATDTSIANEFLDIGSGNTGSVVVNRATAGVGITQSTGTTYLGSGSTMNVTKGSNVTSGTATLGIASVILASNSVGTGTLNSDTAAVSVTGSVSSGVGFAKTLALTGSHVESAISGIISNGSSTVALTKSGTGTWTLTSANTYDGATNISGGKLVINGDQSSANGTVTVSGADTRLAGDGTIGGNTTIESSAIHSPGSSPGVQKFTGDLTYADASIFEWDIDRAALQTRGVGYDGVNVIGTLAGMDGLDEGTTTDAVFRIVIGDSDFSNGFWDTTRVWTDIFTAADGIAAKTDWTGIFGGGFEYFYNNGTTLISISPTGQGSFGFTGVNNNELTWTAVPESTTALAGLLLTAGLLRRRRG
jgi:autotransporter-associated beta strand protein